MALPAEFGEQIPQLNLPDQKNSPLSVFQETDLLEIALKQDEVTNYISFQKGVPWDIPKRFLQHPDASRFRLHGDKTEIQKEMKIAGHAILDWQFDGGDKRIMRIASYALGHHFGYGALINDGLSVFQDGASDGKETVMERTVYFNHPDGSPIVNNFRTPNGFKIVDDRFVTRYPDEIKELLSTYNMAHHHKDKNAAMWAKESANANGYDFEFFYGQPRVVIPGSALQYKMFGHRSYFNY